MKVKISFCRLKQNDRKRLVSTLQVEATSDNGKG